MNAQSDNKIYTHTAYSFLKNGQVNIRLSNRAIVSGEALEKSKGILMACFSLDFLSRRLALDRPKRDKVITKLAENLQLLARILLENILQCQWMYMQNL
jgi:hypothetical protein